MSAPKKTDEQSITALLASIPNAKVDQFKMAGLLGVKKTTVEPWVKHWFDLAGAMERKGIRDGILDSSGAVDKSQVDAGRSGSKKAVKKEDAGDDASGEDILHGIKEGRVTKASAKGKKGKLAKAE